MTSLHLTSPTTMRPRWVAVLLVALVMTLAVLATGCAGGAQEETGSEMPVVRMGTMPTEDMLPAWVAQDAGYFTEEGVEVSIETFDSAQSLSAAITAGQVDMAMTDVMRAVKLCESGSPVVAEWVTLGTEADQGRFGVLAPADAEYGTLPELAAWLESHSQGEASGVGVAANTVPEYVFDMLCEEAGVEAGRILTQEVASLPERYGLVASGQLAGAALPNSLLTMGEAQGLKVIADDTLGANISQSIMVARQAFAEEHEAAIKAVARAWDRAVDDIDKDPASYKSLLFDHANINAELADVYEVSAYPSILSEGVMVHPASELVWPQIEWMRVKGYGGESVGYDGATGQFAVS